MQFSIPPWLTFKWLGKSYFILLSFLFYCRFWLELFLALEQVYRLRAVCPDLHWCDWLHHLPVAGLLPLCGNSGLPCCVHWGHAGRPPAVPQLPEQIDRRNEVWCLSYIKHLCAPSCGLSLQCGNAFPGRAIVVSTIFIWRRSSNQSRLAVSRSWCSTAVGRGSSMTPLQSDLLSRSSWRVPRWNMF